MLRVRRGRRRLSSPQSEEGRVTAGVESRHCSPATCCLLFFLPRQGEGSSVRNQGTGGELTGGLGVEDSCPTAETGVSG